MPAPIITPQQRAKEALAIVGINVTGNRTVVLTDRDSVGERAFTYLVNPSQLEYATDQYRLVTGESLDYEALEARLPWLTEEDFQ